jgi:hypothetical protein
MKKQLLVLLPLVIFTLISCKEDDPAPADETELITTVELQFFESGTLLPPVVAKFVDTDGPGGNAPSTFDNITLKKNTSYNLKVFIKNESDLSAVEDITDEIKTEKEEHQFFFIFNPTSLATFSYLDKDANNKPVGLDNTVHTGDVSATGDLLVVLRHGPDKNAEGVSGGNITNAGGETDVEIAFKLNVQ